MNPESRARVASDGFAGLTFLNLFPTDPDVLGAGDLMASSLMSASLTPKQVRMMLAATSRIEAALSDPDLSPAVEIATANLTELPPKRGASHTDLGALAYRAIT
jgi:hypothetical protein